MDRLAVIFFFSAYLSLSSFPPPSLVCPWHLRSSLITSSELSGPHGPDSFMKTERTWLLRCWGQWLEWDRVEKDSTVRNNVKALTGFSTLWCHVWPCENPSWIEEGKKTFWRNVTKRTSVAVNTSSLAGSITKGQRCELRCAERGKENIPRGQDTLQPREKKRKRHPVAWPPPLTSHARWKIQKTTMMATSNATPPRYRKKKWTSHPNNQSWFSRASPCCWS